MESKHLSANPRSAFYLLGDLGQMTLKSPFIAQASSSWAILRAPKIMYRNGCMVLGPQEAFNQYLLAKQLHKATQKTSGKSGIKPQISHS